MFAGRKRSCEASCSVVTGMRVDMQVLQLNSTMAPDKFSTVPLQQKDVLRSHHFTTMVVQCLLKV